MFRCFIGFVVSIVSWFHRFRGVNGFMVYRFGSFIGFVVSMFSWFHRFRGFTGFVVSMVS